MDLSSCYMEFASQTHEYCNYIVHGESHSNALNTKLHDELVVHATFFVEGQQTEPLFNKLILTVYNVYLQYFIMYTYNDVVYLLQ